MPIVLLRVFAWVFRFPRAAETIVVRGVAVDPDFYFNGTRAVVKFVGDVCGLCADVTDLAHAGDLCDFCAVDGRVSVWMGLVRGEELEDC